MRRSCSNSLFTELKKTVNDMHYPGDHLKGSIEKIGEMEVEVRAER